MLLSGGSLSTVSIITRLVEARVRKATECLNNSTFLDQTPLREGLRPAGESRRQGENGGVQHPLLAGPQRSGEDGLQGGDLQQHDHRVRETRHQGLHLDPSQSKNRNIILDYFWELCLGQGGLGGELKIREIQCSSQKCNKNPLFFSMEHGSVLVQSKREKERRSPKLFDNIQLVLPKWPYLLKIFSFHIVKRFIYLQRHKYPY